MEIFINIGISLAVLFVGVIAARVAKRFWSKLSDSFERAIICFPAAVTWALGFSNGHSVFSQFHCYEEYTRLDGHTYLDFFGNEVTWLEVQFSCGQALIGALFFEAIVGFAFFTIPQGTKDLLGIG